MPLPQNDTPWPPKPFDVAQSAMNGWDAWYSGDTDRLAAHYSDSNALRGSTFQNNGLVGVAKQFMWGRPASQGQERARLHVPIAADIARTSADLLFAEPPSFILGDGKGNGQDRLTAMFGTAETMTELLEGGEVQASLGGCYLRLIWDKEVFEHVQFDIVHADGAIPEWRYGHLSAVTFWRVLHDNGGKGTKVVRHLERHAPGRIEHAVYEGTSSSIGYIMPLADYPELEWAAKAVNAEGAIPTGVEGLTAAYVPNIRPNRAWRNTEGLAALGRSDYDQLDGLLDAADEAYTSMMRELRISKARAFVDQSLLDNMGPGNGARFDMEQEIFSPLTGLGKLADGGLVETFQPDIRHEAHRAIIMDISATILRTAGYSAADFGEDPLTGQMTATEVNSRKNLSTRTRDKKILYWKGALEKLARTGVELERTIYKANELTDEPITVKFPARTGADPTSLAQTIDTLNRAGAISLPEKIRRINPNWDDDQVKDEVAAIRGETGREVRDPFVIKE